MGQHAARRPEPRQITLIDLTALVAGVAIEISLPADFRLGFNVRILSRACLALVPVVIERRVLYGGIARPAEFLASVCGLPELVRSADLALFCHKVGFNPWLSNSSRSFPANELDMWQDESFWPWKLAMLCLAAAATAALFYGRRSRPDWVLTILLLVGWLGLKEAWPMVARAVLAIGEILGETTSSHVLFTIILFAAVMVPYQVFYATPASAAWLRLRSGPAARLSWLEWLSMVLAILFFVTTYVLHSRYLLIMPALQGRWIQLRVWGFLPGFAVSGLLGIYIVRRFAPAWINGESPSVPRSRIESRPPDRDGPDQ